MEGSSDCLWIRLFGILMEWGILKIFRFKNGRCLKNVVFPIFRNCGRPNYITDHFWRLTRYFFESSNDCPWIRLFGILIDWGNLKIFEFENVRSQKVVVFWIFLKSPYAHILLRSTIVSHFVITLGLAFRLAPNLLFESSWLWYTKLLSSNEMIPPL